MIFRGAVGRSGEMLVSPSAIASGSQLHALRRPDQIGDRFAGIGVGNHRAQWEVHDHVFPGGAVPVGPLAVFPAAGHIELMLAAADFNVVAALCLSFGNTLLWLAGIVGPFTGTPAGIAAGIGLLAIVLPASVVARRLGWSLSNAVATPFFLPLMFYAILRSTVLTLRQGGIRWRDTFYPLAALRAGRVKQR